eukprot:5350276-Pyramimonas_sp.AAC.1
MAKPAMKSTLAKGVRGVEAATRKPSKEPDQVLVDPPARTVLPSSAQLLPLAMIPVLHARRPSSCTARSWRVCRRWRR